MDEKLRKHGAISWSELLTHDVKGARSFYERLFGWAFEEAPVDDMVYTLVKANGEEVAGIMATPPSAGPMPPAWGVYVTVADVDAAAKKAVALGGKICLPPEDIPGVGRFCVISDPQGAVLSMITYR